MHYIDFGMDACYYFQKEFQIQGARLFGIDSFSKTLLFARRLSGRAGAHVLTKVKSFHALLDKEYVLLHAFVY